MKTVTLLTKHHKSLQIAPALNELGIELIEINFFDTDQLGTFSGEIERKLSPMQCALEKAKLAVELSGSNVGLGSEGSFGGGPLPGVMNWNQEIICLYQKQPELIIYASAEGPTPLRAIKADSADDLSSKLSDFESQKWIMRCSDGVLKGLELQEVIVMHQMDFIQWPVVIEPDLRAMHSPHRQIMITEAALNLSERLQSKCPNCQAINFWPDQRLFGPPCNLCGEPTNEVKSIVYTCNNCLHVETIVTKGLGDACYCNSCNP